MRVQFPRPDPRELMQLFLGLRRALTPQQRYWYAPLRSTLTSASPSASVAGAGVVYGFDLAGSPTEGAVLRMHAGDSSAGALLAEYPLTAAGGQIVLPNLTFSAGAFFQMVGAGTGVTVAIRRSLADYVFPEQTN